MEERADIIFIIIYMILFIYFLNYYYYQRHVFLCNAFFFYRET